MPSRKILVLDSKQSSWPAFLTEFFEETASEITLAHDTREAMQAFDRLRPEIVFASGTLLSLALEQKLKAFRQGNPGFRMFMLGGPARPESGFHDTFEKIQPLAEFQKRLVQHLPLAESLRVLIVDDEPEIGHMLRDYLENRVAPAFHTDYAENGRDASGLIAKNAYDVVVMDIKMPVMDGRELYREIRRIRPAMPVIVYFDAITGDEIAELRESGWPAIVEKGSKQSAMPDMMALVKKMAYFG